MSYQRELTTFKKGNQLSTCGEYNLQDLSDMFSQTEIDGAEEYTELEDILNEDNTVLSMSVTIMEQLDDDEMNMCIKKAEDCDCGNKLEGKDVICESCEDEITDEYIITKADHELYNYRNYNDDIVVPCSAELDNQMYNESI